MHAATTTACLIACLASSSSLASDTERFAWGENVGWLNWQGQRGDDGVPFGAGRARFFPDHLRGWVWGENVGWINLGQNGPYPEPSMQGVDGDMDAFGVNIDASGVLSGYAWSENIGWISFGPFDSSVTDANGDTVQPRLEDGRLRGLAWGENVGWINLGDALSTGAGGVVVDGPAATFGVEVFCASDLAAPFGIVDITDVDAFIVGFLDGEGVSDFVAPFGIVDLDDVDEFIEGFLAGCP